MPRAPMRDVIVLLPGIMGSALRRDGKIVWGFTGKALGSALFSRGKSIRENLTLAGDDPDVDDLGDGITANELIPDLHLIPGVWKIDGYTRVAKVIAQRFDVEEGQNFFHFAYDWRRDNRVAARKLRRLSHDWLERWREKTSNRDAKLILVAHSMGGLVSRWFLEMLEGWKDTRALITFGTPYRGSLNAVDALANGVRKGPFGLMDLTTMSRSLTSLYQLLPIYPCYDDGDGTMLRVGETDRVPNVDPARAADALAFHRAMEAANEENRKDSAYVAARYRIHPIVGTGQDTNQSAHRDGDGVKMIRMLDGRDWSGDGTVPRVSATPIELSNEGREMFAATQHGCLQNADVVLTQFEGMVTGLALDQRRFRGPPKTIALEVEDLLFEEEPLIIRARIDGGDDNATRLKASLVDATTNEVLKDVELAPAQDGWRTAKLSSLPAGAYRVQVSGVGLPTAEDAFAVAEKGGV
jgi:pimeloyl-ACP methyl ester carboxylesterase